MSCLLLVTVVCGDCGEYTAGTFNDPLPELYERWVLGVHQVEQALHHAAGCDQAVGIRVESAEKPDSPVFE